MKKETTDPWEFAEGNNVDASVVESSTYNRVHDASARTISNGSITTLKKSYREPLHKQNIRVCDLFAADIDTECVDEGL